MVLALKPVVAIDIDVVVGVVRHSLQQQRRPRQQRHGRLQVDARPNCDEEKRRKRKKTRMVRMERKRRKMMSMTHSQKMQYSQRQLKKKKQEEQR